MNQSHQQRIPEIDILFDNQLLGQVLLDPIQDSYPWYSGTLLEGPALPHWRDFVDTFYHAELEFDYLPHHPEAGPYEETELAEYVEALRSLMDAIGNDLLEKDEQNPWLTPWIAAPVERLQSYLNFLDWQRWQVIYHESGDPVESVGLPPALDFQTCQFSFRS
jgi:hypothetical protein